MDLREILSAKRYDYVDFGCSNGGSLKFGRDKLGGTVGIGLDIDPAKIKQTQAVGFDAVQFDVTQLVSQPNCTRFVTMKHFLEHLPNAILAEKCIIAACEAATDFIYIRQPWFDSDGYLFDRGLKLYWSDWSGHTNLMTSLQFYRILRNIPKIHRWRIYARNPIIDSSDDAVHPLTSPRNQHGWSGDRHPAKPQVRFTQPTYREIGCVAVLNDDPKVLKQLKKKSSNWTTVLLDSRKVG